MTFFLQTAPDSLTQTTQAIVENVAQTKELTLFEFVLKGGVFLIPIVILFIYTIYLTFERYFFIKKMAKKTNAGLMESLNTQLNSGNLDLAIASVQREETSEAKVLHEGLLTIGRPISEIESNMEKVTNIEIAQMEKKLNHLGTIAGIAPTLGFVGTISGVIKIFYNISITENISIANISGGLYEKMISSGAGLIVGIIAYAAYHLLNGKIDNFALQAQKNILKFINIIQRPNGHKEK
ncbi:MotA/TolQ/ExbB proton channel family protein [Myroides sp. JBRI-B21084]|uniref:MotA/TolQ/ExbB proton channel family protein n=1 Tax=Myroides sp. JBRI-B21084 TaxID=3119977 RepID=UPI0026E3721D|nr:MotA/TolQ/ExbB proton channel family protein [Paenimyroides cloacae]WKW47644.1 MotA/TolQ/ExbB proton channel family protein [Paenimyroides cloacae]